MSRITEASRDHIADEKFAFPRERKEPTHDAAHVRNAIARFGQVEDVTGAERDAAWKRIESAAKKYSVEISGQPSVAKRTGRRAEQMSDTYLVGPVRHWGAGALAVPAGAVE